MNAMVRAEVLHGLNDAVLGIRILFHPEAVGKKDIIKKAIGGGRGNGYAIVDGMMIFSHRGENITVVAEHKDLLRIEEKIERGDAYFELIEDSFFEGIAIMTA